MNSHPDRQGYPLSSRNGLPQPLFLHCGSCWWVCLSFQHGFLILRLYVFILFYLFFCQCVQPRASITLMLSKGPCLIFIDFQRSIWFSSANPPAPQVFVFFFQTDLRPFFLWSNHVCGIFTRWATADTVMPALVSLCIQDTLPSMCGSQPALNDPKVTAAVAHPCCLYQ